jgi:hypothetical protein
VAEKQFFGAFVFSLFQAAYLVTEDIRHKGLPP